MKVEELVEKYRIVRHGTGFTIEARVHITSEVTITSGFWPLRKTTKETVDRYQWQRLNEYGSISGMFSKESFFETEQQAENFCEYLTSPERIIKEYDAHPSEKKG